MNTKTPRHPKHLYELPGQELAALIALACAGLNGHRTIGDAMAKTRSAAKVVADAHDHGTLLPDNLADGIRRLGTGAVVAKVFEITRLQRMTLLTPDDDLWPIQLSGLGHAEPCILWAAGNPWLLLERPVAITGNIRPTAAAQHDTIELASKVADAGWSVAAINRPGVDQLALLAAGAMDGRTITVANQAHLADRTRPERSLVISENPMGLPTKLGSALRAHMLLAVLADKVVIVEALDGSGALRTGVVAHAFDRPLGVTDSDAGGTRRLINEYGADVVDSLAAVERLH
jgi:predicted Rossmann fold nucleotide-binding protein DprA/Smf involved in DNA uptake